MSDCQKQIAIPCALRNRGFGKEMEIRMDDDKSNALTSVQTDSLVLILNDQGGANMSVEKSDISPTLRSESHQHEPIICLATQQGGQKSVWKTKHLR